MIVLNADQRKEQLALQDVENGNGKQYISNWTQIVRYLLYLYIFATDRGNMSHKNKYKLSAAAIGAVAVGSFAFGAMAIGALAIGTLAVRRIAVYRGQVRTLEIGELTVGHLTVKELEVKENFKLPAHQIPGVAL